MQNSIIIPVRAGSKGLKDKNIRPFCGQPLLGYVLTKLCKSDIFEHIIVTSDSDDYLSIADKYGATDLIKRPLSLASDTAASSEVLKHAISKFEENRKINNDKYFLTQVTSPLWLPQDLIDFVNRSMSIKSSLVSVCLAKQNPYYNLLEKSSTGYSLVKQSKFRRRQDHPEVYFINGCFYSFEKNTLFSEGVIREPNCDVFIMNSLKSIDIDNLEDFILCELLAQKIDILCQY